ncbi:MAG: hypothetical protein Q8835_03465, partial [Sweet potato little leaf phytoplasma]|nr:hypothetical protein [Sweet potato little leaf phytoplasma]
RKSEERRTENGKAKEPRKRNVEVDDRGRITKYKTKSTRGNEKYLVAGVKKLPEAEAEAAAGGEGGGLCSMARTAAE